MGIAALAFGIYMDNWHEELDKQLDAYQNVDFSDYLVSGFGSLLILAAVIFMIPASIMILVANYFWKGNSMGQHKHNPTAIAAKNGELPPKKPKMSKRERNAILTSKIEEVTGINKINQAMLYSGCYLD